jgi:CheY-like chemotaxis protein
VSTVPTVYFIDDSATMREVIKIAFRRENINVVAYNDAASALSQIESSKPDIVITDVIMPDKDGYEVCQFIKGNANLSEIPVILMSGVVNKQVAERAFSVKADELIRKPFQPQDLITRVRHLLKSNAAPAVPAPPPMAAATAAAALSSIFQQPAKTRPAAPAAAAPFATPSPVTAPAPVPAAVPAAAPRAAAPMPEPPPRPGVAAPSAAGSPDVQKLRFEVMRLESLVKKLQSDLSAERDYSRALEEHVKTLQEND